MNTQVVVTADGSHSVFNAEVGQHYHSIYGAVQESDRVFIELGLLYTFDRVEGPVRVFEMGFGTGLNTLMTIREAKRHQRVIDYVTVEAFPIPVEEARQLNYDHELTTFWLPDLHEAPWGLPTPIVPELTLTKYNTRVQDLPPVGTFDLVYYDAFAPEGQPELWTLEIFQKMASLLRPGGALTTYCSKSAVQRNLRDAGFDVEKHVGPARKREVIRAIKM
ncbi:tRNA (5-methylaminomethyl-2-thiouridine)(34)-methyltransferase MnmD [Fibrella forsythiae]|uniref:tRNA (5-methylaminomethyl-2-thiouridine)(34)-methyltransferase MnmD n=1 Tax=Fibrella forsythiae TaxID=2817061 RepID=A0ABS3JKL4_9BACT|nr:tRNA (5-methylaminomethyl-2-thiouridine)(34)-methyltransferase MnmD [Fibrella forsythiae]MBO0950532.1 tRNA (5-methylaminomethyl-2-thiouridine)(34)-methyltransferase MnmD [Fibrella forsythiae]